MTEQDNLEKCNNISLKFILESLKHLPKTEREEIGYLVLASCIREIKESPSSVFSDNLIAFMIECIKTRRLFKIEPIDEMIAVSLKEFANRIEKRDLQCLAASNKVIATLKHAHGYRDEQNNFKLRTTPETQNLAKVYYKESLNNPLQSAAVLEFIKAHDLDISNQLESIRYDTGSAHVKLRMMVLDQRAHRDDQKRELFKSLTMSNLKSFLEAEYIQNDRVKEDYVDMVA